MFWIQLLQRELRLAESANQNRSFVSTLFLQSMNVKFRTIGAGRFVLTPCRACMYFKIRISRAGRFVSDLFLQGKQVKVRISRAGHFVSTVSQGYVYILVRVS